MKGLHTLPKITHKAKRRLGQGHGSGRVKTAGRGTKGQNARGKMPSFFEGGAVPLTKRLPFLRGKGKNKSFKKQALVVNVGMLNVFKKDSVVDLKALISKRFVDEERGKAFGVKILGDGTLSVSLIVKLPVSKGAAKKIQKAGGTIEGR